MNYNNLNGKNIIFFGPETFNYHNEIVSALTNAGAHVTFCGDKPFTSILLIALLRLKPKLVWPLADKFYSSWIKSHAPQTCDIVLVIKGEGLSPYFLDKLRECYKNATFTLYLWDSISNVKNVEEKFSKFDHIFSFDPEDCKRLPNIKYRPLFFLEKYYQRNPVEGKGIFFIGTLNGDRAKVLNKLSIFLKSKCSFSFWLFIRSKPEFYLSHILNSTIIKSRDINILTTPMPITEINKRINNCAAVLDIEHPRQKGLTMRTFEVLASGKKLITTNKSILLHDFYDPSRIAVIERNAPVIDDEFLTLPSHRLPDFFLVRYSLKGWIGEILDSVNLGE